MITEVSGVRVGHYTDIDARTGCTVVLFPEGTVASAEVRGGAPATRDLALLDPSRLVERLDALVLSGGSAFGLSAGDGVMGWLEEQEIGFNTSAGAVPIVVGLSLFDLNVGDGTVRPGAAQGRQAAEVATDGPVELGQVGVATGATLNKWRGQEHATPGHLGGAVARMGELTVAALIAVNATGEIDDGTVTADINNGSLEIPPTIPFENTTIGVVVTNAKLTKQQCHLVAQSGQNGFARALVPSHTLGDGDVVVGAATGQVEAELTAVRILATHVVEAAIRQNG